MEAMENSKLVKRIMVSDVGGEGSRGRPGLEWMNCVMRVLGERGMAVQQADGLCLVEVNGKQQ